MNIRTYLLLTIFFSTVSNAGEVCEGEIERLGLSPITGDVHVQIQPSTGIFRICNIETNVGKISGESCRVMYSTLLAARASRQKVAYHFPNGFSCASLGSWGFPSSQPTFFEIEKTL